MIFCYKHHKIIKIAIIGLFVFCLPFMGFAQTTEFDPYTTFEESASTSEFQETTGLGNAEPVDVASRIINVALTVLGLFTLLLIIWGGYIWMNARGNQEEVEKAKKILTGAVIGLIIILASYGVASFIFSNVQRTTDVNALNP